MFQNIEGVVNNGQPYGKTKIKKLSIFANVFELRNIAIYVISFMVSLIGLGGELSPFSISIFAACFANSIPLLGVAIVSVIGSSIKYGVTGALSYMLTALVMIATFFIIKPKYNEEERNEKVKVSKNVFIASFLVQFAKTMMAGFTIYDLLVGITFSVVAVVFYKIFVNSLIVLQDFREKRAFSIEEVIGASLLISIAVSCFGELNIFGFGIRNILSILIVMILGWKNGILVGTTSGVTIGVTIGIIASTEPIMIAAYAISGMIAGILNRFGKLGVIIGFALGNVILAYVSNGYTIELIHFKEILIASIGLLAVPKTLHIDLEEFIGNSKFLPVVPNRALNKSKEVAENLNNVSEAIQEMATAYKKYEPRTFEENTHRNANKQIFIAELLNNLEPYRENMLYDDIANVDGKIIDKIFSILLDKQQIEKEDLLKTFAECNSYIIESNDNNVSKLLEKNINEIVRTINMSYRISKSDFIWRKKVEQNNANMEKQLNGVSKAIQNMAKDIQKELELGEKYEKENKEIIEILKQKDINIEDISISKEDRYIVDIYLNEILETLKINTIEKVLTKVLKENIVLNDEVSVGKKLSFISGDKYVMAIGSGETIKSKSQVSGDSILNIRLKDGKYLVAISDGMGSGQEAKKSSTQALRMLENLLLSGFDKNTSLELINTSLINQNSEVFSTLDIAIIDLYKGTIEFIKSGACPTYIKNKKKVQIIKSNTLPAGIIDVNDVQTFDKDISTGDIMLMCSDGILDSNVEYKNKELWIKYLLEDIETNNTQKIADLILSEAIDNNYGIPKDDMSIIVCKFMKKED